MIFDEPDSDPQHRPPISIDDTLVGHQVLEKAKTLGDLFGEDPEVA